MERHRPRDSASKDRIDGIAALIMAIARSLVAPREKVSIYETEGLFMIDMPW